MNIDVTKAYMLRSDGKVLECESVHPYILLHYNAPFKQNLNDLLEKHPDRLTWFYENTQFESTRQKIMNALQLLIDMTSSTLDEDVGKNLGVSKAAIVRVAEQFNITPSINNADLSIDLLATLEVTFKELNFTVNQEFLRFRFGSMYVAYGNRKNIYFRISSIDFDWFPLIWDLVHASQALIDSVTIVYDQQSRSTSGRTEYCIAAGQRIDHITTGEFLSLPGRPVIESVRKEFLAEDCGPFHNVDMLEAAQSIYIRDNFEIVS